MDATDKKIINRIQSDLPISPRPYLDVAKELNLDENDVIQRIKRLKEIGIIRRIGGNFSPEKIGFSSTLCAAKVPLDKVAWALNYAKCIDTIWYDASGSLADRSST